jgi:hypothetical protein
MRWDLFLYRNGWPFRSLASGRLESAVNPSLGGRPFTEFGITPPMWLVAQRDPRFRLGTQIQWPGFLADVGFYSAAVSLLWLTGAKASRKLRRAAGQCPACGYDRSGLPAPSVCPECGRG